jgi:hypothetical protein
MFEGEEELIGGRPAAECDLPIIYVLTGNWKIFLLVPPMD